jgi:hypothetical protein
MLSWRSLIAVALSLLACSTAVAAPASKISVQTPDVYNPSGAPFVIKVATEEYANPAGTAGAGRLWSFAYEVQNTTASVLRRIGLQATVFGETGQVKGYFIFETPTYVQPGASVVSYYTTAAYRVAVSDHVVLLPYSAAGEEQSWRVTDDELRDLTKSLVAARGNASNAPLRNVHASAGRVTPQNPFPDPGTSSGCTMTSCQNAQTACKDTCSPCGLQSANCSCNADGTVANINCSCYQCTPPK